MMRRVCLISLLALLLGVAWGCSESVDQKLQLAQIAISQNKYDRSLALADQILAKQPDNIKAIRIKTMSLLRIGRLDAASNLLKQVLEKYPDDFELHKQMVQWAVINHIRVLSNSSLIAMKDGKVVVDQELMGQLNQTISVAKSQADWMAKQPAIATQAEADFVYAQLADLKSRLLDRHLAILSSTVPRGDNEIRQRQTEVERLQAEREENYDEIQSRLLATLKLVPGYTDAMLSYTEILSARKNWDVLWGFLQQSAKQDSLQEHVVAKMVVALLAIPEDKQSLQKRQELGWKLQDLVPSQKHATVDWWLTSARLHLASAQYDKAVLLLKQALLKEPTNIDVRYLLANCYYYQDDFQEADALLKPLAVQLVNAPNVAVLNGMNLRKLGNLQGAREAFRHALDLDPNSFSARQQLIQINELTGSNEAVAAGIQAVYERNLADPRAARFLLQYERSKGNVDNAANLMMRLELLTPRRLGYWGILTDGYFYLRQYDKAEEIARGWVAATPNSLQANLALTKLLLVQNKKEEALALVGTIQKNFSGQTNLDETIGRVYLNFHAYEEAIGYLNKALSQNTDHQKIRLMLAQAQHGQARDQEALHNIKQILDNDPSNFEALSLQAQIYQAQGKTDLASEALSHIDISKVDAVSHPLIVAQVKFKAGDYDAVISIVRQALFSGQDDPALRLILSETYIRKGKLPEAEEQLLALQRSQPDNWQAYSALTRFYIQNQLVEQGIKAFTDLKNANLLYTRLALSDLLINNDQPARALEQISVMLDPMLKHRDPRTMTVASRIASLELKLNRPDRAKATYQKLIDAHVSESQAQLAQIDLALSQGQAKPQTIEQLQGLIDSVAPEQDRLAIQIALRLQGLGATEIALKALDKWLEQSPQNINLILTKSGMLQDAGKTNDAVMFLAKSVKDIPENVQLWHSLAKAYTRNYQFPQAIEAYQNLGKLGQQVRAVALTESGQLYTLLGLDTQATANFEELEQLGKVYDPRIYYAMGLAAHDLKKDDLALTRLEQVPMSSALYVPAQLKMMQIDLDNKQLDQARQRFLKLVGLQAAIPPFVQILVDLNLDDSSNRQILRWSEPVIRLEALPANLQTKWLEKQLSLNVDRHDWDNASKAIQQLIALHDLSDRVAILQVLLAYQDGNIEVARKLFRENKKLVQSEAGVNLSILLDIPLTLKQLEKPSLFQILTHVTSEKDVVDALKKLPPQAMVFRQDLLAIGREQVNSKSELSKPLKAILVAKIAIDAHWYPLAISICEDVLKQQSNLAIVNSLLLEAHGTRSDKDRTLLQKIAQSNPNSSIALLASSQVSYLDKNYKQTVQTLEKLLADEPDNPFVQYRLAGALLKAGDDTQGMNLLKKIIQAKGRFSAEASNDLAYLLALKYPKKLDEARKLVEQAGETIFTNPSLRDTLGWIDHLQAKDKDALDHLVRASASMPKSAEIHYHLGVVYGANGYADWAKYHLQAASLLPGADQLSGLADALKQVNK